MNVIRDLSVLAVTVGAAQSLSAAMLTFEEFAPAGSLVNVSTSQPYMESGFQFMPSDDQSAVFDAAADTKFPGNSTSWFGFASSNAITLSASSGQSFSLDSLLIGPSTLGAPLADITVVGNLVGGGSISQTFTGLSTATEETLGWTDLTSVVFTATTDAAIDDVSVSVPEPASAAMVVIGLMHAIGCRRSRA